MSDSIETDNAHIKCKISLHESGHDMLVFSRFRPENPTDESLASMIKDTRSRYPPEIKIVRICLDSNQIIELKALEKIGFIADGYEFAIDVKKLAALLPENKASLPEGFSIRKREYEHDIDFIVRLEKTVHAADQSSRVNFETEEAVAGMKGYYKRACDNYGVYLLLQNHNIVGLIGFMPENTRFDAIHISSVAIDLTLQGRGLFFPFLVNSLALTKFHNIGWLTGVTTTTRLIEAAKRYGVITTGISLARFE